jgi:hypothetical protein
LSKSIILEYVYFAKNNNKFSLYIPKQDEVDKEVKILLGLKEEYKKLTGEEWKPEGGAPAARAPVGGIK